MFDFLKNDLLTSTVTKKWMGLNSSLNMKFLWSMTRMSMMMRRTISISLMMNEKHRNHKVIVKWGIYNEGFYALLAPSIKPEPPQGSIVKISTANAL